MRSSNVKAIAGHLAISHIHFPCNKGVHASSISSRHLTCLDVCRRHRIELLLNKKGLFYFPFLDLYFPLKILFLFLHLYFIFAYLILFCFAVNVILQPFVLTLHWLVINFFEMVVGLGVSGICYIGS